MKRRCKKCFFYMLLLVGTHLVGTIHTTAAAATGKTGNGMNKKYMEAEMGMVMESEMTRRFLEATKYITAAALKRDLPVCGGNGARGGAYNANCLPPPSNTYDRALLRRIENKERMERKDRDRRISVVALCILVSLCSGAANASPAIHAYGTCNGSIAECSRGNELLLENEIVRRFLEGQKHISYGALNADRPACDASKGEPYRSCLPQSQGSEARGCPKYYQCRSSTHD
ncbi:Rapid ALkalinization Factor [Dillenia turbinata]|uniref:Rapid ALkalinization Factor n=1 Tax=Dillenia turbinata TaxID=194707 RepID=A0AAN8VN20_9MAGN